MSIFISLVACPSKEIASILAKELVEQGLAACVQVIPGVQSVYRWQGSLCIDEEALLVIKSASEMLEAVKSYIEEHHPYEVPEFVALNADNVSEKYAAWVMESVKR